MNYTSILLALFLFRFLVDIVQLRTNRWIETIRDEEKVNRIIFLKIVIGNNIEFGLWCIMIWLVLQAITNA